MKKLLTSAIIFVIILSCFELYSNASAAEIKFATTTSTVTVGKEFEVLLSLSDLGPFTDGINSAGGVLSYDTNYVSYVSISAKGSWQLSQFNQTNGKFLLLTNNMELIKTGPILSIKFKLNNKPSPETKTITLSNVSITDGMTDEIEFDPINLLLNVTDPPPPVVNNTTTNTTVNNTVANNTTTNTTVNNTIINNTINNTIDNNTVDNNTVDNNTVDNNTINNILNITVNNSVNNIINILPDNSTSKENLPYAGFNTFIISSIIVAIISGVYAYYRYKRLNVY